MAKKKVYPEIGGQTVVKKGRTPSGGTYKASITTTGGSKKYTSGVVTVSKGNRTTTKSIGGGMSQKIVEKRGKTPIGDPYVTRKYQSGAQHTHITEDNGPYEKTAIRYKSTSASGKKKKTTVS